MSKLQRSMSFTPIIGGTLHAPMMRARVEERRWATHHGGGLPGAYLLADWDAR